MQHSLFTLRKAIGIPQSITCGQVIEREWHRRSAQSEYSLHKIR